MQVGVTHLVAGKMPAAQFLEESAAAGYEVVELAVLREGELTVNTPEEELKRIVAHAGRLGLKIASVCLLHLTGNLLASGEAQERGIAETEAGLRIAAALGAGCALHTLGRLSPELFYDDAYRNGVDSLRRLAPSAKTLNVALAFEFTWSGFLFSPVETRRFLDEVGSDAVGFYFDPGNMAVFQYPQHWARITGPHIKMVHVKDWEGNALNGGWPALLKGKVDFVAVNRELRAAGYDGPLISEVSLQQATLKETADAIRKIIAM
jgi:hexulose-6-phosphate isomerase